MVPCNVLCGTRTRKLFAIASLSLSHRLNQLFTALYTLRCSFCLVCPQNAHVLPTGITGLNSLGFQTNMMGQLCRDGLHVSPRTAPSKRTKLCTCFAWFLRPSQLKTVPYFELRMPISRVQLLMQFRMGSHALPVEQVRLAKPAVPRHLRRCTLCGTRALGDERHFVCDCLHFAHIRRQFRSLHQDADGSMQCFVWHKDQKAGCHYLATILDLADDSNKDAFS